MCASLAARVKRVNFMFELLTGLYMLDAWEKVAFNAVILSVVGVGAFFLLGGSSEIAH
jgi:hypothetical protein